MAQHYQMKMEEEIKMNYGYKQMNKDQIKIQI